MTSLLVEALLRSSASDLEATIDEALLEDAFTDDPDDNGAVVEASAAGANGSELLRDVFGVAEADVQATFECALLDVALLPTRALLTDTKLHLFSSIVAAVEPKAGKLRVGDHKRWVELERDALAVFDKRHQQKFAPLRRIALRGVHRVTLNAGERSFHVAMLSSDAGLSQTFIAKSAEEAKSWVVSLRVAVAAAQHRVLKRSIKLAHITGVHSPLRDIVLGDHCLTLAVEAGDSTEHVWLGRVSDFDATVRRLSELWIAALDAGPPPDTPARDEEADALFVRTFKLPDEVLRSLHPVALVLDGNLRAKGEMFLTDNLLCLHIHSLLRHMLAVVPWTSIEEIANDRFLLARGVDVTVRLAAGETRHLALSLPGDHNAVRAELRALWTARRASAKPGAAAALFDDTGAQFLNARAKQFQERFGADIPITEQVQYVFSCALWRSDERCSGEFSFTPNFLALPVMTAPSSSCRAVRSIRSSTSSRVALRLSRHATVPSSTFSPRGATPTSSAPRCTAPRCPPPPLTPPLPKSPRSTTPIWRRFGALSRCRKRS